MINIACSSDRGHRRPERLPLKAATPSRTIVQYPYRANLGCGLQVQVFLLFRTLTVQVNGWDDIGVQIFAIDLRERGELILARSA